MQLQRGGDEIAFGVVGMVPGFGLLLNHEVGIVTSIHPLHDGFRYTDVVRRLRKLGRGLLHCGIVWGCVVCKGIGQSRINGSSVRIHIKGGCGCGC